MDQQSKKPDDPATGSDHGDQGRASFHSGSTTQGGSNFGQGSSQLGGESYQQGDTAGGGTSYENEAGRLGSSAEGAPAADAVGGVRTGSEGGTPDISRNPDAATVKKDNDPDRERGDKSDEDATSLEQETHLDE